MDYVHMQMKSETTRMPLPLDLLIPRHGAAMPYKSVYLLHDLGGNQSWWIRNTGIEALLEEENAVLIMPSCLNSFYVNMYYGSDFFDYISEELPRLCEGWMNLDKNPAKRMIAGVGMGGYGALHAALKAPEVFGSALSIRGMTNPKRYYTDPLPHLDMEDVFGPEDYYDQSDFYLPNMIRSFQRNHVGQEKPRITLYTEQSDPFQEECGALRDRLEQNGFAAELYDGVSEGVNLLAEKVKGM